MKQWKLFYEFSSAFTGPASEHYYKLRCFPREYSMQKITFLQWDVQPYSGSMLETDHFGNRLLYGSCMEPHDTFDVTVKAVVMKLPEPEMEPVADYKFGMLRSASPLTSMGAALRSFYVTVPPRTGSAWERAGIFMSRLYEAFRYETASTRFNTSAEEAFSQGCGVCQDYAHILLALLREEHITARYVAGTIPGEGQTHAWVEVLDHGLWKGFDPTHNKETDEEYISFTVGRDALDCGLNRGILKNAGEKTQTVKVKMEEF